MSNSAALAAELSKGPCGDVEIRGQRIPKFQGRVAHTLAATGLAVLQDAEMHLLPFKFDAIYGYGGETAKSLGLGIGSVVEFAVLNDEVVYVHLLGS